VLCSQPSIIYDECVGEYKEETPMKDDSLPPVPHPLYHDIRCYFSTANFHCERSFPNVSTSSDSQDTSNVSLSLHYREETSSSENTSNLSYVIYENIEGENPYFSSTPLHDSSNHKDVDKHPKFSDLGCHNLSTSSSDHDVHSLVLNPSKPLVYHDLPIDEVETLQTIDAI